MPKRPPLPPEASALVRAHRASRRFSRRTVLAGAGAGLFGVEAALSGCGTSKASVSGRPTTVADRSRTDRKVRWANWPAYLDYDENRKDYPTLESFKKKTGLRVAYGEEINDNGEFYGKVQEQLHQGKDIGWDVIALTDWMSGRLVRQGLVQRLDTSLVPNAANIRADLKNVDFDKGREYSLTWQSGYTGIAYHKKRVKELGITIGSVDDLWNKALKNRVMMLSEMRDTIGLILLQQGKDVTGFTEDDYDGAIDLLQSQVTRARSVRSPGTATSRASNPVTPWPRSPGRAISPS
jgi:spermidine/putrescine transport system substrate-binding protein